MSLNTYWRIKDPGHDWLQVPAEDIKKLSIGHKITVHSRINKYKGVVWLDGRFDVDTFLNAASFAGLQFAICNIYYKHKAFIRAMPSYNNKCSTRSKYSY